MRKLLKVLPVIIFILSVNAFAASNKQANFLGVSDIHLGHSKMLTKYGEDTGQELWLSTKLKLIRVIQEQHPKFMVVLGDLPAHGITNEERYTDNGEVFRGLRAVADVEAHLPVFYVTGNNDSMGGNYHSFTNKNGETPFVTDPSVGWPGLNAAATCDKQSDKPCLLHRNQQLGFYSAYPLGPNKHLRLIALNTVIFSKNYVSDDGVSQKDAAATEMQWLSKELKDAKQSQDKVIIAMHIPPGFDGYTGKHMWHKKLKVDGEYVQNVFLDLINKYKDNISIILSGHTHYDEVRKLYNSKDKFVALGVSVPGITPQHNNNPAFKEFIYSDDTYDLLNQITYYTNPISFKWLSYSFNSEYDCGDKDMYNCVASKSKKELQAFMKKDFAVKNSGFEGNWKLIDKAIDVKPLDSKTR